VTGRPLPPSSPFGADDGSAAPAVLAALAAAAEGRAGVHTVVAALLHARVLAPVVARLDQAEIDPAGHTVEKVAHLATVTVTSPDGRRGVPVFTSLVALAQWDPDARPFPLRAVDAARGVFDEDCDALLVDPASPHRVALTGSLLLALAEERPWLPPSTDPVVAAAVADAVEGLPGLAGVSLGPADDADLLVTVVPERSADGLEVAQAVAARLAAVPVLRARLDRGLDLAVADPSP